MILRAYERKDNPPGEMENQAEFPGFIGKRNRADNAENGFLHAKALDKGKIRR